MASPPVSPASPPPADPWAPVRERAVSLLVPTLQRLGWNGTSEDLQKALEPGPEGKADLALPTFRLAKPLGRRPDELARALAEGIGPTPEFQAVRADGGFVNFHLELRAFTGATLRAVLGLRESYGKGAPKTGTVCVEHTSANPTGPLHVGRSRTSVIGDTLVRVLRAAGWKVIS